MVDVPGCYPVSGVYYSEIVALGRATICISQQAEPLISFIYDSLDSSQQHAT